MSQENIDLVRSAYTAYNRRDVEGVLGRFDPMIDWHTPSSLAWGAHVTGIDAVGAFFRDLAPYVGDRHEIAMDGFLDAGDRVVALVRHLGIAPGGEEYEIPAIMVWTIAGGRLAAMYEQLDTLAMARATEGVHAA
jgi:ketosteroid isomerase-like protein